MLACPEIMQLVNNRHGELFVIQAVCFMNTIDALGISRSNV